MFMTYLLLNLRINEESEKIIQVIIILVHNLPAAAIERESYSSNFASQMHFIPIKLNIISKKYPAGY